MSKFAVIAGAAASAMLLSGCVLTSSQNIVSAITLDVQNPAFGYVDNSVKPVRCGEASATGILCFSEGDASIKAAMENGQIKKVHHVDYKTRNFFGVVGKTTTLVYGE